jgi:thiamine kinase-like enzyme
MAEGEQYVARFVATTAPLPAIDRDAEFANARLAAEAGVGPRVIDHRPDAGLMLFEWINGTSLTAEDVARPECLTRIAQLCRTLHAGPRFAGDFDLFTTRRRYLAIAHEQGCRIPAGYVDLESTAARIEDVLRDTAPATVPCHNDLVAENVIEGGERLWFIDYEYSANADPCYELGNLSSAAELDGELRAHLVTAYLGHPCAQVAARVQLYGVLCDYTWTLWAAIHDATADSDIDFSQWGPQRYARARGALRSSGLSAVLDAAAGPGPH